MIFGDIMKFYKVLKNNKVKDGGDFDYTDYLPSGKKSGEWTPEIKEIELCEEGYHVTPYWNMYYEEGCDVYEVETRGLKKTKEVGVIDKFVCKSIKFIKKIDIKFGGGNTGDYNTGNRNTGDRNTGDYNTGDFNTGDFNTGDRNTGHCNTGDYNTGDFNTGDRNTGGYNTGNRNTGHCNTGDRNTGDYNTGDRNTGDYNTGYRNTGDYNTGDFNTGHCNTGDRNTGHFNTGDYNTGNRNTGYWNTGSFHTGFFNTLPKPPRILVFNKECSFEEWEKAEKPDFIYFDLEGGYKKSFKKAFKNASPEDVQKLIKLPNFDYKVFEEISGITREEIKKKLQKSKNTK